MCVLCKDTFSRSDILKRHFQKCSLRRGNPTGASHLSHPHAHVRKSQAAAANAAKPLQDEVSSSIPPSNGIAGTTFGNASVNHQNGLAPSRPGITEQQPLGYSMTSASGMNRGHAISPNQADHRPSWMAAPKQSLYLMQSGSESMNQVDINRHSFEQAKPPMMHDPTKRPGIPGQQAPHAGEIDWTSMFPPAAPDGYMNPVNPVFSQSMAQPHDPIHTHVDSDRKYYPATTAGHPDAGLNGLYLASTTLGGDGMRDPGNDMSVQPSHLKETLAV